LEPLVARLLAIRGLSTPLDAQRFLDPRLTLMHDPSLLPGIDSAAARILNAARSGESIVLYGDYDVDGVTGVSILFHALTALCPDSTISIYIPHRIDEGYGLNDQAITSIIAGGATLIVSVDCGITAALSAKVALDAGVDLIITDHHNLPPDDGPLPDAYALVHPALPGSTYPFDGLCGAGVAFKLAWRLMTLAESSTKLPDHLREVLLDLMAFAALGTIADVVPLIDENRIIARFGMQRLRTTNIKGLTALIEASSLDAADIDAERVAFSLAPRINACGRLGHAREAVELFTTADPTRAEHIAQQLTQINERRRTTERSIVKQAVLAAQESGMTDPQTRAIVLADENWHAGVIGICCSRLIGQFNRPTILLQIQGATCKGSARSIDGFNLHAALVHCAQHLTTYGGHDMAAGMTLPLERLEAFTAAFTTIANESLTPEDLVPSLHIDCQATLADLTPQALRQLEHAGPFGRGNPKPTVLLRDIEVARPPEPFGSRGAHLSVHVRQGNIERRLVGWRLSRLASHLHAGDRIHAVVEPKLNKWNGRQRVEPTLLDLTPADTPVVTTPISSFFSRQANP